MLGYKTNSNLHLSCSLLEFILESNKNPRCKAPNHFPVERISKGRFNLKTKQYFSRPKLNTIPSKLIRESIYYEQTAPTVELFTNARQWSGNDGRESARVDTNTHGRNIPIFTSQMLRELLSFATETLFKLPGCSLF